MHSKDSKRNGAQQMENLRNVFALLLDRHTEISGHVKKQGGKSIAESSDGFSELIRCFLEAHERDRWQQEEAAIDFNILEVLQLTHNERRHSMVLAWLLDHDVDRYGSHAQGVLGLRLFLSELGLPEEYLRSNYWVNLELQGDESIVDIEIAARGAFLIHIENKIWASEGMDQTGREWADIRRRAAGLGINTDQPNAPVHAFFLTPAGRQPESPDFKAISWRRVVRVLTAFSERAKPVDVKLFAAHYAKTVERFIVAKRQDDGVEHVETAAE